MSFMKAAILNFSNSKNSFLAIPSSWCKETETYQDVTVFRVEYADGKKAYFSSTKGESLIDIVYLSGKYALTLGFKDGEEVMLSKVDRNIPAAERVSLEPLDSDDWEIMSLNSKMIEADLLNQVRVVWEDQVFPVWVRQSSFFVRVAEVFPKSEPAILAEWTEVHVVPKERKQKRSRHLRRRTKKEIHSQYNHLRKRKDRAKMPFTSPPSFISDTSDSSHQGDNSENSIISPVAPAKTPVYSLLRFVMKSVFPEGTDVPDGLVKKDIDHSLDDTFQPLNLDFLLRVIPYSKGSKTKSSLPLALQSTTIFISERTFRSHCNIKPVPYCFVAKISKLLSPAEHIEQAQTSTKNKMDGKSKTDKLKTENKDFHFESVCVNVVVMKSAEEEFDVPEALFLSTDFVSVPFELKRRLGLEVTSRIRCQSIDYKSFAFNSLLLYPLENLSINVAGSSISEAFSKWIEDADLEDSSIVLSDGTLCKLPLGKGKTCDFVILLSESEVDSSSPLGTTQSPASTASLSSTDSGYSVKPLSSTELNYGYLSEIKLKRILVKLGSFSPHMRKSVWPIGAYKESNLHQSVPALSLEALGGVEHMFENVMKDIDLGLKLRPISSGMFGCSSGIQCILLHGQKGVGKSTFIKAMCKKLINYPHFVFVSTVNCLPMRGKRTETISKRWENCFDEAVHRQPSLVIFEDLDQLASATLTAEQEAGQDSHYFASVAQVFIRIVKRAITHHHRIVIIATSKSIHSLHPSLLRAEGQHVFHSVIEMKTPDIDQRGKILQSLVLSKLHLSADSIPSVLWKTIALKTEGYVARDLDILVDRATLAAMVRTKHSGTGEDDKEITLITSDFEVGMQTYIPSSLQGLQLHKKSDKSWKDVGGLHNVKEAIQKTITWPVKYKMLFKNYNLRPQCNILLYGEPGTGKTLIAGAIANECGINFISVKGPELLSKYVGASEKAVRDLFSRAASAKPCIIFFDEFDALAPRRGHDSTGVTDRVVNQLLTQMDGVESIEDVYVIAATSRPELIDPALLRPGRLDKCLHCPLPDENERLEILEALAAKLSLGDGVDFKHIAQLTENFSGADLQAVLYSAQVEAIHDSSSKKTRKFSTGDTEAYNEKIIDDAIIMPSIAHGVIEKTSAEALDEMQKVNKIVSNMKSFKLSKEGARRRRSTISIVLEHKHILDALSKTRPSVSKEERQRYELVFSDFQAGQSSGFNIPKSDVKRVTLA